ncbi:YdaU family protein [Pseudomonas sp.]|uniref:YdaU family protein n=1 Tax=Pseudomonas sp. TaxID=306 RepID=UPI003FD7862C
MAALPYMQLYVADYLADTMHLTTEEHGAYLLLIFNYWQTGKPIPVSRLARITRLSNERWTDVERSLGEFFNERSGEWVHDRIERDLEALHATQAQRIAAGKASAEARKNAAKPRPKASRNDRSTPVEISFNENSTNKEEKRREDIDQEQTPPLSPLSENPVQPPAAAPEPKPKRKSRLPEPFNVSGDMRKWAADRAPAVHLVNETEKFVNYWRGNGTTKADWIATWRNWLLKAQEDANRRVIAPQRTSQQPLNMSSTAWAEEPIL